MINVIEVSKLQDKINIPYDKTCCISCGSLYSLNNKIYIVDIKNYEGENYIPLCKDCLEQLKLNIELETLEG